MYLNAGTISVQRWEDYICTTMGEHYFVPHWDDIYTTMGRYSYPTMGRYSSLYHDGTIIICVPPSRHDWVTAITKLPLWGDICTAVTTACQL